MFFSSLLAIATALSDQATPVDGQSLSTKLFWLGLAAAILVYLQSILGALVASQWSLHQCFATQDMCIVLNTHLLGVIPATIASIAVVVTSWLTKAIAPMLRRLASIAGLLVIAQVAIGY